MPNETITPDFHVRTNKLGYRIIGMSQADVIACFGGHGICDHCGRPHAYGYLAPVLGRKWYCTPCHTEWETLGKFYVEDVEYESMVLEEFKESIKAYEKRKHPTSTAKTV